MDATSLIEMVRQNEDQYPPHVVVTEQSGHLKITKKGLKTAIKELVPKIEKYDNYM